MGSPAAERGVMKLFLLRAAAATLAITALAAPGSRAGSADPLGVPAEVPGPSWLHAELATHPIVENSGGWAAAPLMVSGAEAYRDGEYLFQDFIYDAHGANTTDAPALPPDTSPSSTGGAASAPTGDLAQPTDAARFGNNVADLLEVRAKPELLGVRYRVTLNTLLADDATIVAIGIDTDRNPETGSDDWGAGIGSLGQLGLEHVILTWGDGATLDGAPISSTVDVDGNQIDIQTPLDAGNATWRHYLVAGVHDPTTHTFAAVDELPSATRPGGAHATAPPPVLNVGFRTDDDEPMGVDTAETGGRGAYGWGNWREHGQAKALAARDISRFSADIDFDKLHRRVEASTVPTSGFFSRLFVSHRTELGEGVRPGSPGDTLLGPIQPYGVYIPEDHDPDEAASFTLLLHAAACNYNQYGVQAPAFLEQLTDARGGIVATPEARGPTVGYGGIGEVDTFEMWADLAHNYRLDFDRVALTGISMGGAGTFRLASLYPDLFTKAFPIAGTGSSVVDIAENLRNVPLLMWNGIPDELVSPTSYLPYQQRLEELRYRHRQVMFPARDHLVRPLGTGTDFSLGAAFLGNERIDRDPRHVTYRVMRNMDDPALDLRYSGAYWVSGLALTDGAEQGTIEAVDLMSADGDPLAETFTEPGDQPEPHIARGVDWTPTKGTPINGLDVSLADLAAATIDLSRTDVDVHRRGLVTVDTTTPTRLHLAGLPAGTRVQLDGVEIGRSASSPMAIDIPTGAHVITFGQVRTGAASI
jgi:pimeloyl-ACP methyl ester carboxylesterase